MSGNQWEAYKRACSKHGKDSPEAKAAYNSYAASMARYNQRAKPRL